MAFWDDVVDFFQMGPHQPQRPTYSPPAWDDVSGEFRSRYPDMDQSVVRQEYDTQRNLMMARERHQDWTPPAVHTAVQAMPFASAYHNFRIAREGSLASRRIQSGNATDDDYNTVAMVERARHLEEQRSPAEILGHLGLNVTAMYGEGGLAGRALGAASRVPYAGAPLRAIGIGAETAAISPYSAITDTMRAGGQFVARNAVQTAAMPSMYLEHAVQNNEAAGRHPDDIRGYGSAYATGMIQTAILGSLGKQVNAQFPGRGFAPTLRRIGYAGPIGLIEQQVGDTFEIAAGLKTGYGVLGDVFSHAGHEAGLGTPEKPDAWKAAASAWLSFAAFSTLHEPEHRQEQAQRELMQEFADRSRELANRFVPREQAAEILNRDLMQKVQESEQTRAQPGTEASAQPPSNVPGNIPPAEARPDQSRVGQPTFPVNEQLPGVPGYGLKEVPVKPETPAAPEAQSPAEQAPVVPAGQPERQPMPSEMLPPGFERPGFNRPQPGEWAPTREPPPIPRPRAPQPMPGDMMPRREDRPGRGGFERESVRDAMMPSAPPAPPAPSPRVLEPMPGEMMRERQDRTGRESVRDAFRPEPPAPRSAEVPAPAPEPPLPLKPEPKAKDWTNPAVEELFHRRQAGEVVSNEAITKAAGWDERLAKIMWDRLSGRTQIEIAKELGITDERVRQLEKQGMQMAGIDLSVKVAVHEGVNAPVPDAPKYRGGVRLNAPELLQRNDPIVVSNELRRAINIDKEIKKLSKEYLNATVRGKLTPEREREITERVASLTRELAGGKRKARADIEGASFADESRQKAISSVPEPSTSRIPESAAARSEASAPEVAGAAPQVTPEQRAKAEPMPATEYRETGGTQGGGPLIEIGSNKTAALAKEKVKETRAAEGLAEIEKQASQSDEAIWQKARETLHLDSGAATRLATEVVQSGGQRALNTTEKAMLLHRTISVRNELDAAIKGEPGRDPLGMSDTEIMRRNRRIADLKAERELIDKAGDLAGSESGRTLRIQRMLAKYDYSLSGMLQQAETAKQGKLTEAESKRITELQDQITKLQEQLNAAEDNVAKGGKGSADPSYRKWVQTETKVKKAQQEFEAHILAWRYHNMPLTQKVADWVRRIRVAEVISSPITAGKIGSSSVLQLASAPARELIGTVIKNIPGFRQVAERAPVEGRGFNAATELAAIKEAGTQGIRDALDIMKTGKSDLDVNFGPSFETPRSWIDLIGNLHAAEKAPAVRGAYERAFQNIEASERAAGKDVTTPAALRAIGARAYAESLRAKFQQDNVLVEAINKGINHLKRSESTGANALGLAADVMLPVRRTPTNIIADTLEHVVGLPVGVAKTGVAWAKGIENLTPTQADSIMRMMKKGTLGMPLLALGYYLSKNMGGFYTGRRDDSDLKPGEIKVGKLTVPSWVTAHHPVFMALQLGATVHRAQEGRTGDMGIGHGSMQAMGALFEELPLIRAFEHGFGEHQVEGLAKSLAVPQLIQWLANMQDRPTLFGTTRRRTPHGIMENIETGIPGLRQRVPLSARQPIQ